MINKIVDKINALLTANLHLYVVSTVLFTWGITVAVVLIYPNDIRLNMAKDVGFVLLALQGIVGGVHASKQIWGGGDDSGGTK